MTKTRTKAEILEELIAQTQRADDHTSRLESILAGKIEGRGTLAVMLGLHRETIRVYELSGMPVTKSFLGLQSDFVLADVVRWLQARAREDGRQSVKDDIDGARYRKEVAEANLAEMAVTEAAGKNPLVAKLEARIAELETEVFHLKDDSVPPPLPQAVVDALYDASSLIDANLSEQFALLQDEEDHPGFLDDLDEVVDSVKSLGILQSRIRQSLDADAEWHSKIRLEASQAKLDKANASLAKTLAEAA